MKVDQDDFEPRYQVGCHKSAITSLSIHPLNEYAAVASKDSTWSFHNIFQGVKLTQVEETTEVHSIQFHPDGLILATGIKNGSIKLWDIRE